jgi:alpha-galactosidase
LRSPFDPPGISAWQFTAEDKSAALLCVVVPDPEANPPNIRIRLKGLDEKRVYQDGENRYTGAALMYGGYVLPGPAGDYPAFCVCFEALNPAQDAG